MNAAFTCAMIWLLARWATMARFAVKWKCQRSALPSGWHVGIKRVPNRRCAGGTVI